MSGSFIVAAAQFQQEWMKDPNYFSQVINDLPLPSPDQACQNTWSALKELISLTPGGQCSLTECSGKIEIPQLPSGTIHASLFPLGDDKPGCTLTVTATIADKLYSGAFTLAKPETATSPLQLAGSLYRSPRSKIEFSTDFKSAISGSFTDGDEKYEAALAGDLASSFRTSFSGPRGTVTQECEVAGKSASCVQEGGWLTKFLGTEKIVSTYGVTESNGEVRAEFNMKTTPMLSALTQALFNSVATAKVEADSDGKKATLSIDTRNLVPDSLVTRRDERTILKCTGEESSAGSVDACSLEAAFNNTMVFPSINWSTFEIEEKEFPAKFEHGFAAELARAADGTVKSFKAGDTKDFAAVQYTAAADRKEGAVRFGNERWGIYHETLQDDGDIEPSADAEAELGPHDEL